MTNCNDCGSWGHRAGSVRCPYREALRRQDPFGIDPPRPSGMESRAIDPALRDATATTVFLPGRSF